MYGVQLQGANLHGATATDAQRQQRTLYCRMTRVATFTDRTLAVNVTTRRGAAGQTEAEPLARRHGR